MNPSQLKWQKFAGFVLPMLLGWLLFAWVIFLSHWVEQAPEFATKSGVSVVIFISRFLLVPIGGFAMGMLNVYC